jgi:hypothetical protein
VWICNHLQVPFFMVLPILNLINKVCCNVVKANLSRNRLEVIGHVDVS